MTVVAAHAAEETPVDSECAAQTVREDTTRRVAEVLSTDDTEAMAEAITANDTNMVAAANPNYAVIFQLKPDGSAHVSGVG